MTSPRTALVLQAALAALALTAAPAAQELRVDYPDSTLVSPPELLFPFYTLGSGGTVRYQVQCPATFPGLPATPHVVTKVGFQLAGRAAYSRFEVRFGTTTLPGLTAGWTGNLPDQRIQHDLSGTVLQGGVQAGVPVNQWVELDLAYPFVWRPGESLTLDIVSSAAAPGAWCTTGSAAIPRSYEAPWRPGSTGGVLVPTGGLKLRIVFEPLGFPRFGQGCAGSGGFAPQIAATGSSAIGGTVNVRLGGALGGASSLLLLGLSKRDAPFGSLPFALGGGCELLVSVDATLVRTATGSGPGTGTASAPLTVPNDPSLRGAVLFAQWLQFDPNTPAALPVVTSDALAIPVH